MPHSHGILIVSLLALLAGACQAPQARLNPAITNSPEFAHMNPADIVILPIVDATRGSKLDAELRAHIRGAMAAALIERRYSPLSSQFVDQVMAQQSISTGDTAVVDAAFLSRIAGKWQEDAVLGVRITRWNEHALLSSGLLELAAEITLVHSKTGKTLSSGELTGTVRAGGSAPSPMGREARRKSAAEEFARAVIAQLPRRRP